jgi:hypothetical protein
MLYETRRLKHGGQGGVVQGGAPATTDRTEVFARWLKECGKDAPIAVFTAIAIVAHLLMCYVWRAGTTDAVPVYLALAVGGIPSWLGSCIKHSGLNLVPTGWPESRLSPPLCCANTWWPASWC